MPKRVRDYAAEYRRRIELGFQRGYSRAQAAGHARKKIGERGIKEIKEEEKKRKKVPPSPPKPPPKRKQKPGPIQQPPKKKKIIRDHQYYVDRKINLQQSYARKMSEFFGYNVDYEDLTDAEKTDFWSKYHSLVDRSRQPNYDEWIDEYADAFDYDYDEIGELEYGPTP